MDIFSVSQTKKLYVPFYNSNIKAGFPSPADDFIDHHLDLNEHLIPHPEATFIVRVSGSSMIGAGIHSGDLLVVDRSLEAVDSCIIVAILDGEFTVKRIKIIGEKILLVPENKNYKVITVNKESNFQVWGVVTYVIHKTI